MKNSKLLLFIVIFLSLQTFAQVYTDKVVEKKNEAIIDSLKTTEYPYSLPIWGEKATQKGYQLPYSAGVSVNYFWQESDIVIDNLYVGFNNGTQYNLDQIIRFNDVVAKANAINIRPDIWLFPFLNVYGILGKQIHQQQSMQGFGFQMPKIIGAKYLLLDLKPILMERHLVWE